MIPATICSIFDTSVLSGCRDQHWFTRSMWDLYLTLAGIASAAAAAIFVLGKQSVRLLARYLPALYHKIANVHIKTA